MIELSRLCHQKQNRFDRRWLQLAYASMPLVEDTLQDLTVNPKILTAMVGFQSCFHNRVLIPHLVQKEAFWGVGPPAFMFSLWTHSTVRADLCEKKFEIASEPSAGLKHREQSAMEPYSGNPFENQEIVLTCTMRPAWCPFLWPTHS